MENIAFGPVPSRRLGRSIGINNIPPKICSYACIYCQLGRAINMDFQRKEYYKPEEVIEAVKEKLSVAEKKGDAVDYLTFVPDGEPTLDVHLEEEVDALKELGYPLAIITNSSLMDDPQVREILKKIDLVSVKVDAVDRDTWKKINRPHKNLNLDSILKGLQTFSNSHDGKLITETMLIDQVNDSEKVLENTANFIATLKPDASYISIPTRPPARKTVKPAGEKQVNKAFQIFSEHIDRVEYLIGYEGNVFAHTGDTETDILSITAVHPMREDAIHEFLEKDNKDKRLIDKLVKEGKLLETEFRGKKFYVRKFVDHQQT
jgi:wyosine [tRNA(Phe)-imidazoG37] synthetase (radical SAM superfamily)